MKGISLSINYLLAFLLMAVVLLILVFIVKNQIGSGTMFAKSSIGAFI